MTHGVPTNSAYRPLRATIEAQRHINPKRKNACPGEIYARAETSVHACRLHKETLRARAHAHTHTHALAPSRFGCQAGEQMAPETACRARSGRPGPQPLLSVATPLPTPGTPPLRPARPRRPPQSASSQPVNLRLGPGSAHFCISPSARLAAGASRGGDGRRRPRAGGVALQRTAGGP